MRDPKRIQRIIYKLSVIWSHQPDTRFMQLLLNRLGRDDQYYLEDDAFEEMLDKMLEEI